MAGVLTSLIKDVDRLGEVGISRNRITGVAEGGSDLPHLNYSHTSKLYSVSLVTSEGSGEDWGKNYTRPESCRKFV